MTLPDCDFVKHASEVVCVSIGANLLLPVAPTIMGRFFSGIEVDPDKIIEQNFSEELRSYIKDGDIRRIGKSAVAIKRRQDKGYDSPGLFWRVMDVVFALIGVVLLWTGWIDHPFVARKTLWLFSPVLIAAGWPFLFYICAITRLNFWIRVAVFFAWLGKHSDKKNADKNDAEIADFVARAKQSIATKKNGKGKKK